MARYPASLHVEHPAKLSRLHLLAKVFLGWLYVGFTHGIILYIYGIASAIATVIAFFIILFTGRYPKALFSFNVGYLRWQFRVSTYMGLLRDEFPPFSGRE